MAIFILGQLSILAVLALALGVRHTNRRHHCCCRRH